MNWRENLYYSLLLNRSRIFIFFFIINICYQTFFSTYRIFVLDTEDKRLRFLQILLKCPVKILDSYLIDLVNNMANRRTRISTTTRISVTTPKHYLFNATEIFLLLVAGADVIIPPRYVTMYYGNKIKIRK